ncbi:hypothetical protein TB2_014360 [Malus domestica]
MVELGEEGVDPGGNVRGVAEDGVGGELGEPPNPQANHRDRQHNQLSIDLQLISAIHQIYTVKALASGPTVGEGDGAREKQSLQQLELLESIVEILPIEKAILQINYLCCLFKSEIFVKVSNTYNTELERSILAVLEHMTVDDLLVLSFTYDGDRLFDLESVRRIISGFVEKEKSIAVFNAGDFREVLLGSDDQNCKDCRRVS